ncbi:MAG: AbrB/MazE/SpoVT family DNA-binding domain-containing protein [Neisseriaceae bacterium]|nr:AbrB/MazE/SpoVT family DNA-binding domain-containing protein [Neisseriaceae bacterium]
MQAVLRQVGGSVMLSLPQAFLKQLNLSAKSNVDLSLKNGKLIVEPVSRPKYTIDELLAQSDYSGSPNEEERQWLDAPAAGGELL